MLSVILAALTLAPCTDSAADHRCVLAGTLVCRLLRDPGLCEWLKGLFHTIHVSTSGRPGLAQVRSVHLWREAAQEHCYASMMCSAEYSEDRLNPADYKLLCFQGFVKEQRGLLCFGSQAQRLSSQLGPSAASHQTVGCFASAAGAPWNGAPPEVVTLPTNCSAQALPPACVLLKRVIQLVLHFPSPSAPIGPALPLPAIHFCSRATATQCLPSLPVACMQVQLSQYDLFHAHLFVSWGTATEAAQGGLPVEVVRARQVSSAPGGWFLEWYIFLDWYTVSM